MENIPMPELNSSIFNLSSIEGILLIIFAIFILKECSKKIVNILFGMIALVICFQVLYILGHTQLDQYIHISAIFKYDVFTSIAQFFPGTGFADILMKAGNWLTNFMIDIVNWIIQVPKNLGL